LGEAGRAHSIAFGAYPDWEAQIRAGLAPRYAASFLDLAEADLDGFDAVAPLQIPHYDTLAKRPDLFGRKFIHPRPELAAFCDDKLALTKFLIANGLSAFVPALRAPGAPYPYVWKRRSGGYGRHCHVIAGPEDESRFDLSDEGWFAQALAPGNAEFATHMLRVGGEIRYVSTFGYEMAGPALVRGERHNPVRIAFGRGCPFLDLFGQIMARLDYEGTACLNFKVTDGAPLIFEINPRFGGSLANDVTAYLDAYLAALKG
jgi:hypothetical protein